VQYKRALQHQHQLYPFPSTTSTSKASETYRIVSVTSQSAESVQIHTLVASCRGDRKRGREMMGLVKPARKRQKTPYKENRSTESDGPRGIGRRTQLSSARRISTRSHFCRPAELLR
jgi:hypothetical protein